MATSVDSGEHTAEHLSTEQWQSFEMRMRRRRVERLLARASDACQEGHEDTAREAIAEIEQLSPSEPRLPELRGRLEALAAISSPPAPASPAPAQAISIAGLHAPDEFTPTVENPAVLLPRAAEPLPIVLSSVDPAAISQREDLLLDLPLVIDQVDTDPGPLAAEPEERRSGHGLALAAAALLACGAMGYFLGPKMVTLVQMPQGFSEPPAAFPALPQQTTGLPAEDAKPGEPLPPVQVAVDEVAAASTTLDTPLEESETAVQPAPTAVQPAAQPPTSVPTSGEPAVRAAIPPPERTELPVPSETPAASPTPVLPPAPAATVDKPPVAVSSENTAAEPPIPASTSPANVEPTRPVSAAPAPTEPAPRAEEKIRAILDQYADAYSRLDAAAASAIFPGVDRRALARAFDGLTSQKVSLGACDVRVAIETAIVDCTGTATWTPKIGGGTRTEPRRWQFRLRDASGDWQMVAAKVR